MLSKVLLTLPMPPPPDTTVFRGGEQIKKWNGPMHVESSLIFRLPLIKRKKTYWYTLVGYIDVQREQTYVQNALKVVFACDDLFHAMILNATPNPSS